VHVTDGDDAGRDFANEYGWQFPILSDNDWGQISQWGIAGHPATILIDEFGRVAGRFYGPGDAGSWDQLVAALG
jgi:peroxiredoxin